MIWLGYDSKRNYLPEPELGENTSLEAEQPRILDFKNHSKDMVGINVFQVVETC